MTADTGPEDELQLGRILRLGWWLVVLGIAAGAVAGLAFVSLRPASLASTVEVMVKPIARDPLALPGRPADEVSIDNEARAASSDAVLRRASAALPDRPTVVELRNSLTVGAVPGSTVLEITVVSESGAVSAARARTLADAYLAERAEDARRTNLVERPGLERQMDEAARSLDDATRARSAAPDGSDEQIRLANDERLLTSRINSLQTRLDQIDRFVPDPGFVQREPSPPRENGPPPSLLVLGAAIVGSVVGLGGATARARRAHRGDVSDLPTARVASRVG